MKLMLSVVAQAGDEIDNITIKQDPATIGRDVDNTVMLEDPHRYISGHHAIIEYQAPDYFITDTSTNGVLVNDATLPVGDGNRVKLSDGDRLYIGDYTLAVRITDELQQIDIPSGSVAEEVLNFSDDPFAELGGDAVQEMIDENQLMPDQKDKSDPFDGIKIPGFDDTHSRLLEGDKQNSPKIEQPPPAYKEVIQLPRAEKKEQQEVTADNILADDWFQGSQAGDSPSEEVIPEDFFSVQKVTSNNPPEIKLDVQLPNKVVKPEKDLDALLGDPSPPQYP